MPSLTRSTWDARAEALADDGFGPAEVEEILGARPARGRTTRWDTEEILDALRGLAAAEGRSPIAADLQVGRPGLPSVNTVLRAFGSWGRAMEAAGLELRRTRRRTRAPRPAPRPAVDVFRGEPRDPETGLTLPQLKRADELVAMMADYTDAEDALDRMVRVDGANSRPAANLARLQLARGEKVRRLAKAMARIRGKYWHDLDERQREALATLAEFAMRAIEVVEQDEADLTKQGRLRNTAA
jgi:hypothetical protein